MTTTTSKKRISNLGHHVENLARQSQTEFTRPKKNPTPATVKVDKKEILFSTLNDKYEKRKFESIDDYDAWDDILCDELGSRAQAAEWYKWYRSLRPHRERQVVHRPIEPDMEPDIFKKNLSNANWETGNLVYCAVADFLWDVSMRDTDCLFLLGCLANLLLLVRVDIEAFFLQNSTIVSEEPRFSELGRDPIIRHMTYLQDYESNTPNTASPRSKAFEIDFIPVGRVVYTERPSDKSIHVQETGPWVDTGYALAWSISERSSENFYVVRCDTNVDTPVSDNLDRPTSTKETGAGRSDFQSLFNDVSFTVAKVAPGGVDLLKNNLTDTLESEDIKLLYESKSAPAIVRAVGQPRPLGKSVCYELIQPNPSASGLETGDASTGSSF